MEAAHSIPRINYFSNCNGLVAPLDDHRIIKRGGKVRLREALAMEYVRLNTNIPVPRVLCAFEKGTTGYIVIDRIEGTDLQSFASSNPDPDVIRGIFDELAQMLRQLQELGERTPQTNFGSWPDGPLDNSYFAGQDTGPSIDWTFIEFYNFWARQARRDIKDSKDIPRLQACLCHGDFAPQNIMVADGHVVAVLDWETFGWYPEGWDEATIRTRAIPSQFIALTVDAFSCTESVIEAAENVIRAAVYETLGW